MKNNASEKIIALVYHANEEVINSLYKSDFINFKTKRKAKNDVYEEFVLSPIDVKDKLQIILKSADEEQFEFEKKFFELSKSLFRIIYNKQKNCIFVLGEDLEHWKKISKQLEIKQYNLLGETVVDKLVNKHIPDLTEIEFSYLDKDNLQIMNLRGTNLVKSTEFGEYIVASTAIISYKRSFDHYSIQIKDVNCIEIYRVVGDFNLYKSLSNSVTGG